MAKSYDLIIVGAGPAGMTAAIYAARSNLKILVIEKGLFGGKMTKTYEIDNYPGFSNIKGLELSMNMYQQMSEYPNIEYINDEVVDISLDGEVKIVKALENEYSSKYLIIATGTQERLLNIPGEADNIGKGVSFCAVCDGSFFRNKDVVVIGGGNSALEESLYLANIVNKVTIVIRRDVFRAAANIQEKVINTPNIEIIKSHSPMEIIADENKVTAIKLKSNLDGSEQVIETSAVFPYIGLDPISSFAKSLDISNADGYFEVDKNFMTSIEGIYACGDVINKHLRQIVTATNDGAIAAQDIINKILLTK